MFNTKQIETPTNKNYISKYLSPGRHLIKFSKVTPKTSTKGSSQLLFEVETEPVTTEGFTAAEGHVGQVGTVKTMYIANPEIEQSVATTISILADELGVRDKVDAISSDLNIEQYAEALSSIICNNEYIWMTINGREYLNNTTGKTGVELQFPKFKMFASKTKVETQGIEKALTKPYVKPLPASETSPATSDGNVW